MGGDAQEKKDEVGGWLAGWKKKRCDARGREKCNAAPYFTTAQRWTNRIKIKTQQGTRLDSLIQFGGTYFSDFE